MLNVNIGLLGHVDSGKTALARALSHTASTAAFDKSPQSQSRGITLDLGFSACEVKIEDSTVAREVLTAAGMDRVQCTLVDCPGHASLIRTVVGGAQIIDAMVLVIDATKGMQAQTSECLVLGEILAKPLLVALNKIDAIQGATPAAKEAALATLRRRLQQTFRRTRWPNVVIVDVAAAPRGEDSDALPVNTAAILPEVLRAVNLKALKSTKAREGERADHLYMLVDHCFAVRGQGTVFTGTVVAGMVRVGDTVLIPEQQTMRKVKGLQVFHKPVEAARSGDRVGLCVAQFDPASMERGVLCSATGSGPALVHASQLIARVHRVRYHPLSCDTHTKFHITIGHATVMGTMRYFARPTSDSFSSSVGDTDLSLTAAASFDPWKESAYVEELGDEAVSAYAVSSSSSPSMTTAGCPLPEVSGIREYYAVLLLEKAVLAASGAAVVAMRLDVERENFCRIALAGTVCYAFPEEASSSTLAAIPARNLQPAAHGSGGAKVPSWRQLPVVRYRSRVLRVDRVLDARSCIADGVVALDATAAPARLANSGKTGASTSAMKGDGRQKSELFAEVQKFVRLKVVFVESREGDVETESNLAVVAQGSAPGAVLGIIDSTFGKTGKVKLVFDAPVFAHAVQGKAAGDEGAAQQRRKKTSNEDGGGAAGGGVFVRPGRILLILKKFPLAVHSGIDQ